LLLLYSVTRNSQIRSPCKLVTFLMQNLKITQIGNDRCCSCRILGTVERANNNVGRNYSKTRTYINKNRVHSFPVDGEGIVYMAAARTGMLFNNRDKIYHV